MADGQTALIGSSQHRLLKFCFIHQTFRIVPLTYSVQNRISQNCLTAEQKNGHGLRFFVNFWHALWQTNARPY
jgi:hypothetical protein